MQMYAWSFLKRIGQRSISQSLGARVHCRARARSVLKGTIGEARSEANKPIQYMLVILGF